MPNFMAIGQTVAEMWRFFDFSRWWPPPSWTFKFFLSCKRSRGPNCVTVPNFVVISQTVAEIRRFFDFPKMAAVCHLGFVMRAFRPPATGIWWSLSLCKIRVGYNHYSSFDNMQVLIFCELGLKTPIHAPKTGVLGGKIGKGRRCDVDP